MELADRITARAGARPRALAGVLGVLGLVGGIAALGLLLPVSEALIVEDAVGVSVFALATNTLSEFISAPTTLLPFAKASTSVVPPPMNGSSTKEPGREKHSMAAEARAGENRAG